VVRGEENRWYLNSKIVNLINFSTEDEVILLTSLLADFDVSTIIGTNDETPIHDELHVGGTRGLSTSGGDVLADFGSRDDDFGIGDTVVGEIDDLKESTNLLMIVNNICDAVDEFDDSFGIDIPRGSLTTNEYGSWEDLESIFRGGIKNLKVSMNDVESIHQLSLVLVNSLHHDIEDGVLIDCDVAVSLHPLRQSRLVHLLHLNPLLLELWIILILGESAQLLQILCPSIISNVGTIDIRDCSVCLQNPSPLSNTIGLVLELRGEKLIEILKEIGLE
jgi:hypothetical protein